MGIFNREINEPRENFKTLNTLADAGRGAVGAGWDLTTKARRHEGKQMGDGRWQMGGGGGERNVAGGVAGGLEAIRLGRMPAATAQKNPAPDWQGRG